LFNWVFARKHNGKFILRIEDTDVERSKEDFVEQIISDLRWLKLDWDEGPDIGGEYGPYVQSARLAMYEHYAKKLLEEGKAYYCYCAPDELEERRKRALSGGEPPRYDGRCRELTDNQRAEHEKQGKVPAVRFKVPEKIVEVNDMIRGRVVFDTALIGDFVIMKSGGGPSFHFAVTVDDVLMKITHVIRGEDHLPNTPRHRLLFEALGFQPPEVAHMSMTSGPGGERLSKRHGAMSIAQYREMGYLQEALVNYMALLGWSSDSDTEIMPVEEIVRQFQIEKMNKSGSIFDVKKLNWMDGVYIRSANPDRLTQLAIPYLRKKEFIKEHLNEKTYEKIKGMILAVRDHLEYVGQVTDYVDIFFNDEIKISDEAKAVLVSPKSKEVLSCFIEEMENAPDMNTETFTTVMNSIKSKAAVKGKDLYMPVRVALTGRSHGPELVLVVPLIGKDRCLARSKAALCQMSG
jgi:nondiscriminating glutamyl-tRNA synthetase